MQGTMPGARKRGKPRTAWMDIKTWTGLPVEESIRMTDDRDKQTKYVHGVANPQIEDGWRTEQNRRLQDSNAGIYAPNSYTYQLLLFFITHSFFHSRLKTFFCKSFPLQPFFFFFFRTNYMIPQTFTVTSNISAFAFQFFCFTIFSCRLRAVDYADSCRLSSAR